MFRRSDPLAHPEPLIRRVYAYVAYRLGDGQDAEDVTSETFARALRYRDSYDRSKGEPISWLLGIARRCVDGALAPVPEILGEVPEGVDEDDVEQRAVARLTLADALAKLSTRDRELIALRYGGDLTAAQIGVRLGLSTNAAEVALHRALDRMRLHIEDADAEGTDLAPVRVPASIAVSLTDRTSGSTGEAV
jgi:RNA polymerase sigma-70 factor (ECF subfamily)